MGSNDENDQPRISKARRQSAIGLFRDNNGNGWTGDNAAMSDRDTLESRCQANEAERSVQPSHAEPRQADNANHDSRCQGDLKHQVWHPPAPETLAAT
jgi:hypothetical protein